VIKYGFRRSEEVDLMYRSPIGSLDYLKIDVMKVFRRKKKEIIGKCLAMGFHEALSILDLYPSFIGY